MRRQQFNNPLNISFHKNSFSEPLLAGIQTGTEREESLANERILPCSYIRSVTQMQSISVSNQAMYAVTVIYLFNQWRRKSRSSGKK
jgi:hypothetical protein